STAARERTDEALARALTDEALARALPDEARARARAPAQADRDASAVAFLRGLLLLDPAQRRAIAWRVDYLGALNAGATHAGPWRRQ
ncbi:MAG: hypothetical protein IT519_15085, partial [Burkholderiales bacterium]|nr:hypothetical protein [Burkholderiales bacterium]